MSHHISINNVTDVAFSRLNKLIIISYNMNEKEITSSIGKFNIGLKAASLIQK